MEYAQVDGGVSVTSSSLPMNSPHSLLILTVYLRQSLHTAGTDRNSEKEAENTNHLIFSYISYVFW